VQSDERAALLLRDVPVSGKRLRYRAALALALASAGRQRLG
jgi:hypothetical protein